MTSTLNTFKHHIGEPRTREWWTPRIKKTSQQEILKRKKQQKHSKLVTDDFPRGTKTKKKTKKNKQTKNNNNKKKPAKHWKFFKFFRGPNFWKTKWTWNFFQQKHYQHTFLLPNLQNKVTFLTFTHPTSISVSVTTWFISPTTSLKHQRLLGIPENPKNSHYSSEIYCYFCRPPSRLITFFFPKWHI